MQQMLLTAGKSIAGGYLALAVFWDIRTQRIPLRLIRLAFLAALPLWLAAVFLSGAGGAARLWLLGSAVLPGALLLLLAGGSREAVGYGDGWSILLLGLLLGGKAAFGILLLAFLLASAYALWLTAGRRQSAKYRFAFLPYIGAGFLIWLWAAG